MRAVIVLARLVLRTSLVRTALVVVVLATSLGFALFSATAARRTTTAFDRFVAWSEAADVVTGGSAGEVPVAERFDDIAALPSVLASQRMMAVGLVGAEVHGEVLPPSRFFASTFDARAGGRFGRALVLDGSIPDDPTAAQGVVDFVTSRQLHLEVGDEVTLLASADEGVPPTEISIEVVAIVSVPTSIPTVAGYQFNGIVMGPAFIDAHPNVIDPWQSSLSLRLRRGLDSMDDLRREMDAAGLGNVDLQDRGFVEVGAERLFTLEATTMWASALLALLVGLPVAYQLLRRDAAARAETIATVLALGVSRRQLALAAAVRGAVLGAVASLLAATGAVLASPLSPVGLARNAEVERGIYVDSAVLALGLPLLLLIVALLALVAARRGALVHRGRAASERAKRSRRVPVSVGTQMAMGTQGAAAVAVIGALAFVSLLVVGIAVAASSLASVADDPEISGGSWDGFMAIDPAARGAVDQALADNPAVSAYGPGGWTTLEAAGQQVYAIYLPDGMEPAIASGQAPRGDHEIALGAEAMRRLDVGLGDALRVSFPGYDLAPRDMTVTGESITAAPLFFSHAPDDSAVVALEMPRPIESDGSEPELVRFAEGAGDPQATLEQVVADLPEGAVWFSFARGRRGDVVALEELEGMIHSILAMAGTLALASLLHQVLVIHRRNASEIAVLRAMGFTGANVAEVGAVYGGTVAAITAVVALPVGLAAGATTWRYLAEQLAVLPRIEYRLGAIGAMAVAVVALAAALAVVLAYRGARRPVAEALRAE